MAGVAEFERIADHGREEAQSDVLNPEDQRVCRTQIAGLHDLGHRGPEGRGNQRKMSAAVWAETPRLLSSMFVAKRWKGKIAE